MTNNEMLKATSGRDTDTEDEPLFRSNWVKISEYPNNFVPAGAKIIIGVDEASPDGDCTVRGFCKDGVFHIQEVGNEPWPEERMDIVGQNGNEGSHYEEIQLDLFDEDEGC